MPIDETPRTALHEPHRDSMTPTIGDVSPRAIGVLIDPVERRCGLRMCYAIVFNRETISAGVAAAATLANLVARPIGKTQ
jgi:hypothetical protein